MFTSLWNQFCCTQTNKFDYTQPHQALTDSEAVTIDHFEDIMGVIIVIWVSGPDSKSSDAIIECDNCMHVVLVNLASD